MTFSDDLNNIEIVQRAVDRIHKYGRFADFELSNGIVLTLKPVPPMLLTTVNNSFKLPEPPVVYLEEKGREEPNPNDPNYLREITQVVEDQEEAIKNLILGVGTSCKSVPDGYFRPEEDGWIDSVKFAAQLTGVDLDINAEDKVKRYICWLSYYAIETGADAALVRGLPMHLSGIREGEVDEVIESFRGIPERGADTISSPQTGSQNGNTANRTSRRSRTRN